MFILFGIPLLVMTQLTDLIHFIRHLYTMDVPKLDTAKKETISYKAFCIIEGLARQIVV